MTTSGTIPRGPFTVDDLESFPDDGNRYEIIDGLLIASPSPVPRHQGAVVQLLLALTDMERDGVRVFVAPLDVELRDGEYVTAADVSGDEAWAAPAPFSASLVPSELVR